MSNTIAAISTPYGKGGISIIRVSGDNAIEICSRIFSNSEKLKNANSHTIHYGYINNQYGSHIDRVLVSVMRAPKTYTGEDTVEINTHGGIVVTNKVLEECIRAGAEPAAPGEFTKRAFLNGKIDLAEAEAVIDIINAETESLRKNALKQIEGDLSDRINKIRSNLISLSAKMQVAIDYPDEDLEDVTIDDINLCIDKSIQDVTFLLSTADSGQIMKEGVSTVIVGKPNVGKSSLLNQLSGLKRAIVTDIAGTTRDVIQEYVNLDGIPLKLFDTAGIHDTQDEIEKIGIELSRQSMDDAELILVLLDATKPIDDDDKQIINYASAKKHIILINKTDIAPPQFFIDDAIRISAKSGIGIDKLKSKIKKMYLREGIDQTPIITNTRHKASLIRANESLLHAQLSLKENMPQDIITIDLNDAMNALGEITGATVSDDIVSEIFHKFCVGK